MRIEEGERDPRSVALNPQERDRRFKWLSQLPEDVRALAFTNAELLHGIGAHANYLATPNGCVGSPRPCGICEDYISRVNEDTSKSQ